jgi:DNA-binding transcriptional regulator LsrR (DeoR family)
LALAIALLRAWIASHSEAAKPYSREWLKKICPICLDMIEATQIVSDTSGNVFNETGLLGGHNLLRSAVGAKIEDIDVPHATQ